MDGRDDAGRERVGVPERAADRSDGRTNDDARRLPERHRREGVRPRVDLQEADVVEEVPADDPRGRAVVVGELDVDVARRADLRALAGVRDHVRAREDVAAPGDDEAGALRGLRRRPLVAEERVDRDDAGRSAPVELRRAEAVAGQRLRGRAQARLRRDRAGLRRRRHDDRLRVRVADPARAAADRKRCDGAETGAEEGDRREPGRAHRAGEL